jgi:type II secretory pathway pseudopilin PulG
MKKRIGLTVIESLVALGILAAVLSLLLPAAVQVRATALRLESMNNLKQITLAVHSYAGNRSGTLPDLSHGNSQFFHSLHFVLLPYIEHDNYYHDVMQGKVQLSSRHLIKPYVTVVPPVTWA